MYEMFGNLWWWHEFDKGIMGRKFLEFNKVDSDPKENNSSLKFLL